LNFTSFQTETNYDYLQFYNGSSTVSPAIGGIFTGTNSPGIVSASSGCITVLVHTDVSVVYSGFSAIIGCGTAPTVYTMTSGSITTCSGMFYDGGGASVNYANNTDQTYTICTNTPGTGISINFLSFQLENNYDFLYIYDGPSTSSTTLGVYSGTLGPGLVQSTANNTSGCITFRFVSDGVVNYAGWIAQISCFTPCQTITSSITTMTPSPAADGIIRICQGQSISFSGTGNFSSSGVGATYSWDFGMGATASGTSASHSFTNSGSYVVNLNITDANGCHNSNNLNQLVQVSTTPSISTSTSVPTLCLGQSATLNAAPTMTPYIQNCTPPVSQLTFLPDGTGVSYQTPITVNCYNSAQTIQNASDIQNVCLNMEHSYLGDLNIRLVCPNGQSTVLHAYPSGGGLYLGCPLDDPAVGPGTGSTYCFTPTATTLLVNGTTQTCGTPASAAINPGNYMPIQSFSNLVGCPMNGQWTIVVTDNLGIDNGYIFNWDINFNPSLLPANSNFTPTITSQGWTAATGLSSLSSTSASVTPSTLGTSCYTYSLTDNFGCTYTANQCVNVITTATPTFNAIGPYCVGATPATLPTTSTNGVAGTWSPATISTATAGTTTYTFTPSGVTCSPPTTLSVTITGAPIISLDQINVSCNGFNNGIIEVEACGGSPGFNVSWTGPQSGNPAGTEITSDCDDFTINGLQPGNYTITTTNAAGCSTTTTATITQPPPVVISVIGHN
jgi:subtilisin-like proprotein convertase family protein